MRDAADATMERTGQVEVIYAGLYLRNFSQLGPIFRVSGGHSQNIGPDTRLTVTRLTVNYGQLVQTCT